MAKDQWHSWGKTLIILAGIIFAGGGYVMKINANTKDIDKVEVKADDNSEEIVDLKLQYKDIENLSSQTVGVLTEINNKLTSVQKTQTEQAVIQAVNSEKLKTLTKD